MTDQTHTRARLSALLLLALGIALVSSCGEERVEHHFGADSAQPRSVAQIPATKFRTLKQTPFERSWDLNLGHPIHTSWISPNAPDLVFFQTKDENSVYAVDTMSGATRWVSMPLPKPIQLKPYVARTLMKNESGEVYNDDRLYLISDDILFCFDGIGGQLIWRYNLPFSPCTGPLAIGAEGNLRVYIGDWQGRVRVITIQPDHGFPYEAWQWNVQAALSASPETKEDLVYIGDHAGKMHCFTLDRDQKWAFPAGSSINGGVLTRDRVLYFGNSDNVLYALNRLSGEKFGQLNFNGPITREPFAFREDGKRVYTWVSSGDAEIAGIYAVTAVPDVVTFDNGNAEHPHPPLEIVRMAQDWHFPAVDRLVCSTPQHLYTTYHNSSVVLAVRRDNGELDWAWDCAEERSGKKGAHITSITEYQDPTDLNRSIYTCDDKGSIIAYRFFGFVPHTDNGRAGDQSQKQAPMPKSKKAKADAAAAAPDAK